MAFTGAPYALEPNVARACAPTQDPNLRSCYALVRTDVGIQPDTTPQGYGPPELQEGYGLVKAAKKDGKGQTIAVVEAYDDPTAESDLAFYRNYYGMPACTTKNGCFQKLNQNGKKSPLPSKCTGSCEWDIELSLDMEMASAICPNCNVIVMEANSPTTTNLGTAVDSAVTAGATVISNSYGGGGTSGASYYDHPGVIITASAGDDGYGVGVPAGFPTVVSVGGTSLHVVNKQRTSETVWAGTGSGCESALAKPTWQTDTGCTGRTMNDVAAVGNPGTGVAVYDTNHGKTWYEVGGTSVSAPLIAGVYGLAGNASTLNAAQSLYSAPSGSLYDVTTGSDGTCTPPSGDAYLCTGEVGYDGPTGNGTPNGTAAF